MEKLSMLSHEELVAALLAPAAPEDIMRAARADAQALACRDGAVDAAGTGEALLDHRLAVARELLLRRLRARLCTGPLVESPQVLRDWLRLHFAGLEHEVFVVLFLDTRHRLIDAVEMFRGTLTQTSVYPREVVKGALARNAAAVAFAHNHPSGSVEPSHADEFLTQRLKAALALVDVQALDHLIVGADQVVSFAERGLV